jgi:hypothetical protein
MNTHASGSCLFAISKSTTLGPGVTTGVGLCRALPKTPPAIKGTKINECIATEVYKNECDET